MHVNPLLLCFFTAAAAQPTEPPALNQDALQRLVVAAEESRSSCLIVWQDGKPVVEKWFQVKPLGVVDAFIQSPETAPEPRPIEAMSATKSIVNLAIGRLVTTGKITSIDQKVCEFYPEWRQGKKKDVTLRHLLDHTSGMQNFPRTDVEIYPAPDFVKLAVAAELDAPPGTEFAYNNKAVNLLAGIVEKASGKKLDEYLRQSLFAPMGITEFSWTRDKADNPHGMSGLQILPADMAKLGQLLLQRGKWDGEQLIADSWIDESMKPGKLQPNCGLLWWLIGDREEIVVDDDLLARMEAAKVDAEFLEKIRPMKGRHSRPAFRDRMAEVFGPTWPEAVAKNFSGSLRPRVEIGNVVGYAARGYLGQYLLVFPEPRLVIVRMNANSGGDETAVSFVNFETMALELWRPRATNTEGRQGSP
jgi:CubicO group peptidase (beta-lactamase class C family)